MDKIVRCPYCRSPIIENGSNKENYIAIPNHEIGTSCGQERRFAILKCENCKHEMMLKIKGQKNDFRPI